MSATTGLRVQLEILRIGYCPYECTRWLRRWRADAVGLILLPGFGRFEDPFFLRLLSAVGRALAKAEADLPVSSAPPGKAALAAYRHMVQGREVDARPPACALWTRRWTVFRRKMSPSWRAGRDLPVIGFDDHAFSSHTAPPLTTIAQPIGAVGRRMVVILTQILAGAEQKMFFEIMPAHLIARASDGSAAQTSRIEILRTQTL